MDEIFNTITEAIDKMLEEKEVNMLITLPEGSKEPEIKSTFYAAGPVLDFYILLQALSKVGADLCALDVIDPDRKEDMIDGMLEMVKDAILEEGQQDEK